MPNLDAASVLPGAVFGAVEPETPEEIAVVAALGDVIDPESQKIAQ